jgi:hypothetical protein
MRHHARKLDPAGEPEALSIIEKGIDTLTPVEMGGCML